MHLDVERWKGNDLKWPFFSFYQNLDAFSNHFTQNFGLMPSDRVVSDVIFCCKSAYLVPRGIKNVPNLKVCYPNPTTPTEFIVALYGPHPCVLCTQFLKYRLVLQSFLNRKIGIDKKAFVHKE